MRDPAAIVGYRSGFRLDLIRAFGFVIQRPTVTNTPSRVTFVKEPSDFLDFEPAVHQ
jgi:hypothetical protein